jgi:lysyl-tRNA synthetase class 1
LRSFLDTFGFDYEFLSSTECYKSGRFDKTLLLMLSRFDKVMTIMVPSLREERAQTYSPFLPIDPKTGVVLQVPITAHDAKAGTISYENPETKMIVTAPVTGGHCKLQWKPDWAMRWVALGVDYEMSGKDLIDSAKLSGDICRAIGGTPPEGFNYELFLDDKGQKISKSKGNGLAVEDWLAYASPESLSLFMYQSPRSAKRLYFDVIPKNVDDYFTHLGNYAKQEIKERLGNPVWHIHAGKPPSIELPISFSMLLNLAIAANAEDKSVLWGFIRRYAPGASPEKDSKLDELAGYAVRYFVDQAKPTRRFRAPDEVERDALKKLDATLTNLPLNATSEDIQTALYNVGRTIPRYQDFKAKGATPEKPGVSVAWFNAIYQLLLGQERGPRFGSFVAVYGIPETRALIRQALARTLAEK